MKIKVIEGFFTLLSIITGPSKHEKSKLSPEKIKALEELAGWSWTPKGGPRKSSS